MKKNKIFLVLILTALCLSNVCLTGAHQAMAKNVTKTKINNGEFSAQINGINL
ncbi:hypothetical protein JW960_15295 [candidate division KSB1 bacterium]|nr:hypothetical protein [candidate division KSB1 bacterium]